MLLEREPQILFCYSDSRCFWMVRTKRLKTDWSFPSHIPPEKNWFLGYIAAYYSSLLRTMDGQYLGKSWEIPLKFGEFFKSTEVRGTRHLKNGTKKLRAQEVWAEAKLYVSVLLRVCCTWQPFYCYQIYFCKSYMLVLILSFLFWCI